MDHKSPRILVTIALLTSLGAVLHLVEDMLPLRFLYLFPGARLGFANIVTLVALILWDWKKALLVAILRVGLGGLLGGNLFHIGFFLSLGGALASLAAMAFLKKAGFSLLITSVGGAICHNFGQVLLASLYIQTTGVFWYLVYLFPMAVPAGLLTGYLAGLLAASWEKLPFPIKQDM